MSQEKFLALLSEYKVAVFFAIIGLLFLFLGFYFFQTPQNSSRGLVLDQATASAVATASGQTKTISIDIEGAVVRPGVYTLVEGNRLQDAVIAAGGFSAEADKEIIAKSLNLAKKVTDGDKIYIPKIGEPTPQVQGTQSSNGSTLIGLNTAVEAQLESLPGIGPATASKIIDNRPYKTLDELVSKKVVSKNLFDKIKDKVTLE